MNKIYLIGRMTREPEIRNTESGHKMLSFGIAVQRRGKKTEHPEADFFNCLAFDKAAEVLTQYVRKGDRLAIVGHVQTGKYTDRDGVEKDSFSVMVDDFELLGEKKGESGSAPAPVTPSAPLPFEI